MNVIGLIYTYNPICRTDAENERPKYRVPGTQTTPGLGDVLILSKCSRTLNLRLQHGLKEVGDLVEGFLA